MKKCNTCGETKELEKMCKEKTYPGGYRPLCLACRKIKQAAYRARDIGAAPKVEGVTPAPTKEFKPWVVDDSRNYYYRNDGLKHIPSRGV